MDLINQYSNVIIAALVVLALIIVILLVWRALSPSVKGGRRGQRLGISEYHELDQTRRLVLVRRDNVEHLILIGGPADVVIENGIGAAQGASAADDFGDPQARPIAMRPAPRAPTMADRRPPPLRTVEPPLAPPRPRDPDQP